MRCLLYSSCCLVTFFLIPASIYAEAHQHQQRILALNTHHVLDGLTPFTMHMICPIEYGWLHALSETALASMAKLPQPLALRSPHKPYLSASPEEHRSRQSTAEELGQVALWGLQQVHVQKPSKANSLQASQHSDTLLFGGPLIDHYTLWLNVARHLRIKMRRGFYVRVETGLEII